MLKELEYPFNAEYLIKKKKHIRKELLSDTTKNFLNNGAMVFLHQRVPQGGKFINDYQSLLFHSSLVICNFWKLSNISRACTYIDKIRRKRL